MSQLKKVTYSKTVLSFWSPQMRISAMDRRVSTRRLLLLSVTVWFLYNTEYKYLEGETETQGLERNPGSVVKIICASCRFKSCRPIECQV